MSKILGIDPGTNITGYGIITIVGNKYTYLTSGSIKTSKSHTGKRLHEIFYGILELMKRYNPTEVAIEQVFMHTNANTAIKLGQARGAAIVAVAHHAEMKIAEYAPRQIKQALVGYGNADKQQMQHMVKLLLKLPHKPQVDEADALAIAICHAHWRNNKLVQQEVK